jgi:hypothetical protein
MDGVEDIGQQIVTTFPIENGAEKRAARENCPAGRPPAISAYYARRRSGAAKQVG